MPATTLPQAPHYQPHNSDLHHHLDWTDIQIPEQVPWLDQTGFDTFLAGEAAAGLPGIKQEEQQGGDALRHEQADNTHPHDRKAV